jgi:hypothetical protein
MWTTERSSDMATSKLRELLVQKKHESFSVWFGAMQLRAAMQKVVLPDITEEEWKAYDRPYTHSHE